MLYHFQTQLFVPPTSSNQPILPKAPKPSQQNVLKNPEPSKPRFRPLLPRKMHYSPLKQISPILKKYNQKRYLPDLTSKKNKTALITRIDNVKTNIIVPKHVKNLEKIIKEKVLENDKVNLNNSTNEEHENQNTPVVNVEKSSPVSCNETPAENNEVSKASDCVDFNGNECDGPGDIDVVDEGDEEIIDDEAENLSQNEFDKSIPASNSVIKKHSSIKKKNKQQRDLESSLALLQPNLIDEDPKVISFCI